tara:strand:+ start:690 stop:1025 length:336 start_codon:yes stop_codon:yes gene_type:complete
LFSLDVTLNFLSFIAPLLFSATIILNVSYYFLVQSLKKGKKGKTFDQIAEWLNKKGYLSVRGKKFKGNHVHSIVKKKRLKDEKLEREYPEVRSDFYLDIYDKRLVTLNEDY